MADHSRMSLAQAILATVDAIMKAQVHASRSFLSSILQMGFGHKGIDEDGHVIMGGEGTDDLYRLEFVQEREVNGKISRYKVSVPTLAALPINPLMIHDAEIDFRMKISHVEPVKAQGPATEADQKGRDKGTWDAGKRPWFLVEEPKSFVGEIVQGSDKNDSGFIGVKMNLGTVEVPDALGKYINSLSEFSIAEPLEDNGGKNG